MCSQFKTLWEAPEAQAPDKSAQVNEVMPETNILPSKQKSAHHHRPTSRSLFSKYASSCSDCLIFICISRFCWKEDNRTRVSRGYRLSGSFAAAIKSTNKAPGSCSCTNPDATLSHEATLVYPQGPGACSTPQQERQSVLLSYCRMHAVWSSQKQDLKDSTEGIPEVLTATTLECTTLPSPEVSHYSLLRSPTLTLWHSCSRSKQLTQCFEQSFAGNFTCHSVKFRMALPTLHFPRTSQSC